MRTWSICFFLLVAIAIGGCGAGSSGGSDSKSGSTSSSESTTRSGETQSGEESGKAEKSEKSEEGSGELAPSATPPAKAPAKVAIPTNLPEGKLATADLKKGTGAAAKPGDEVTVQYIGVGVKSEETFDSSWEREEPLSFVLGEGTVIKGWDEGLKGMKVGGRRELWIPPQLAYGSKGTSSIGPNEQLVFVVDLLSVKPSKPST
jgi:peptidylprolyl isomerase